MCCLFHLLLVWTSSCYQCCQAFALVTPSLKTLSRRRMSLMMVPVPPPSPSTTSQVVVMAPQQAQYLVDTATISSSWLTEGTASYLSSTLSRSPQLPSITTSLQERHIPTAEEIEAKKRNFNLWFWGGGFVAPFLATIFYFGPKFWTK